MSDDESPWIDMDGNINEMSPQNKSPTTYSRPNTPEIDKLKVEYFVFKFLVPFFIEE